MIELIIFSMYKDLLKLLLSYSGKSFFFYTMKSE